MKTKHSFKSFLSLILSAAIISALVLSPMPSVLAESSAAHQQPGDGKVYIYKTGGYGEERWGNNSFYTDVEVVSGKTYTFSALWKAGTNDRTLLIVDGTTILSGQYSVRNGALFDPYTGRISYTFVASSDSIRINAENCGAEIQEKNYSFADPRIFESDSNGNAVANGDVADCDVDFCDSIWNYSLNWGNAEGNRDDYVTVGNASDFPTRHAQLSNGKVYAHPTTDEWLSEVVAKTVEVAAGKTYKFSILWKAGSNDHTQISVNGTVILSGGYNVLNGATFDPYTGRLEYVFEAAEGSVQLKFDNQDDSFKQKNHIIADPQLYEADSNGNAVENGYTAECDVDFCNWGYCSGWNELQYQALSTTEMNASDFAQAEKKELEYVKPEDGELWVFTFNYDGGDQGWTAFKYENNVTVIAGKRYTFNMLWKDLGNCQSIIRVNNTEILNGGYNTVNGATFDPTTGRLSYTFIAASTTVAISIENLDDTNKRYKNYSFADPRMYETDADGNRTVNGDEADCDGDFEDDCWHLINNAYQEKDSADIDAIGITSGNAADFVLSNDPPHSQYTENGKVYAVSYLYDYTQRNVKYSPFVFKGRTYTFSMYYKVFGSTTTRISVDGTKILDGDYNTVNGAKYDAYTGLLTYTFTAQGNAATVELDNLGNENSEKYHSYKIASPKIVETDKEGNIAENGYTADCDADFCEWSSWNYNNTFDILSAREEIDISSMAERTAPHTQPSDDEMYVLSYDWDSWNATVLHKDVFVLKGKKYTLKMFWQDNSKTTDISVDGITVAEGSSEQQSKFMNGATYDVQTGLLTYTFTASSNHIALVFKNNFEGGRKNHCYKIANPLIYEVDENGNAVADGDIADCDVDFCTWFEEDRSDPSFKIVKESDFGFAATVKFGDVNGDGAFNIIDLVAAKKQAAGIYKGEFNYMSLGKSASDKTLSSDDLAFIRALLLGKTNGRSKAELNSLISVLHNAVDENNGNKYALGVNLGGSTKVTKNIEAFENKFGSKPSYVDFDMCSLPFINESNIEYTVAQLVRFNREGGFVALTSHWLVPTVKISETSSGGANNSRHTLTAEQYAEVYTAGNALYDNFREELAVEAEFIKAMKNYGISVIYRPLHECNYGSFWWCANTANGITPEMVARLYDYVYDYFTNECDLDNIIWQFNADAKHDTASLVSPSKIDMLSLDCYLTDVIDLGVPADYENLSKICGDKAFAVSEFYAVDPSEYGYNITSMLNRLGNDLKYKFAYLGIYCNLDELTASVLPDNVLTLPDTAALGR